jgi:hypothetical protein
MLNLYLSLAKEGSLKKGGARIDEKKKSETSVQKLHVLRKEMKERMKFTSR